LASPQDEANLPEGGETLVSGASGSIDYLGSKSQWFGINRLELVSLDFASWNQLDGWLRQVEGLRRVA
jgi:hypothetical protein